MPSAGHSRLTGMEFQDVIRRRRMVRHYDTDRPVPPGVVDRILQNGLRAPSAGFSQGWAFLVLDDPADVARFRAAARNAEDPDEYFAAQVEAPLLIVPLSHKDAYLDRYALPDKGHADRSDAWWPAPYWDIDTGFAALQMLLTVVDAGLGACFFGLPADRIDAFRAEFGVPPQFTPIGAISIGYSDEPPRDLRDRRRPTAEVLHRGQWGQPVASS
jgi:nitroreductase